MFKLTKKNKKDRKGNDATLAIDIGTHTVKTVLFRNKNQEVEVIGYSRVPQSKDSMHSALIVDMNDVLDKVDAGIGLAIKEANELVQEEIKLPQNAIVGIAGELVRGIPIIVNVDREDPNEEITKEELINLINKVKEHTFESTIEDIAEDIGFDTNQIVEIDTLVDSIYVDNVKLVNPIGLKGAVLKCKVFSTFAPRIHHESIVRVIKELGLDLKKIVIEPYALSLSMEGIKSQKEGCIFIDIGGGTTDIAIVQNGEILGTKMFAIGGRVFTKRIQKDLQLTFEEAEDLKIKHSRGKLSATEDQNIKTAISKDLEAWRTGVEIALEGFEDIKEFPPNIFLCGGGALLPEIMEELLSYPWMEYFNFKKHPSIKFFFPNKVSKINDRTKKAKEPEDVTPLALARISLDL